eukprot:TRINITY_DN18587_c0_g1_i1.p3 TRINITY_DN18587_c0_g1~~TRINITY_DN18587_c0_g1_i1.p3  ORF type:complete len:204 (+),score=42.19 TRINITY_DN18587_c0_g1_i1:97-708(+)
MPILSVTPALAAALLVAVIHPVTGLTTAHPAAAAAAAAAAAREDPVPWCTVPEKQIDFSNVAVETFDIRENFNGFLTMYKWTPSLCAPLPQGDYCQAGFFIHGNHMDTEDRPMCYEELGDLRSEAPRLAVNATGVTITYFTQKSARPKYAVLEIECNRALPPNTIVPSGDVMYRSTSNPYAQYYTFQFQSRCACPGGCQQHQQ